MYTNSSMTIFNKKFNKVTRLDEWKRTIIEKVFWNDSRAYNIRQTGLDSADAVTVFVPFDYEANKEYIDSEAYKTRDDIENYFTIQEGDRIVKGEVLEDIESSTDLDKKFKTFTITKVDKKDFGSKHMRHWQIGGR